MIVDNRFRFKQEQLERQSAEGYHGMQAERLDTENDHLALIETAAGNQLYYHIVDNKRIASEIIGRVNAGRGRGSLDFLALDSMRDGEPAAECTVSSLITYG